MEKTLKILQTLAKIGKVLSMIVFVCCCVGGGLCLIGMVTMGSFESLLRFGGIGIRLEDIIQAGGTLTYADTMVTMLIGLIACAGEAVVAMFAHVYFRRELDAGTPFTLAGAKEMLRLGILTIAIPIGTETVSALVYALAAVMTEGLSDMNWDSSVSVSLGITFLVVSVILRYGAELSQSLQPAVKEEEMTHAEN